MEQSSSDWLESEIETAEILTHLHQTFSLFSHVPYSWVCRKKRSAIRNNGGAATAVIPPPPPNAVIPPPPNPPDAVKVKASSPTTPLSFPTTESDEKNKHSEKRTSLKRKREHYLNKIQDLTKTQDSLTQEIANVKRECEQLKVVNSELKAKGKEEIANVTRDCEQLKVVNSKWKVKINGPKSEDKNPNLVMYKRKKLNDIIKNSVNTSGSTTQTQEQTIQPKNSEFRSEFNQTRSLGVASSSSMGRNSEDMGPLSIPKLNLSFETNIDLSKVRAAQARHRRIHILRIKKAVGSNSKQREVSNK